MVAIFLGCLLTTAKRVAANAAGLRGLSTFGSPAGRSMQSWNGALVAFALLGLNSDPSTVHDADLEIHLRSHLYCKGSFLSSHSRTAIMSLQRIEFTARRSSAAARTGEDATMRCVAPTPAASTTCGVHFRFVGAPRTCTNAGAPCMQVRLHIDFMQSIPDKSVITPNFRNPLCCHSCFLKAFLVPQSVSSSPPGTALFQPHVNAVRSQPTLGRHASTAPLMRAPAALNPQGRRDAPHQLQSFGCHHRVWRRQRCAASWSQVPAAPAGLGVPLEGGV